MVVALHRALVASPARLIGIGLPDLVGDRWAQNQPGTDQEYPNWRVPLRDASGRLVLLEYRKEDPQVPIKEVHKMSEAQVKLEEIALSIEGDGTGLGTFSHQTGAAVVQAPSVGRTRTEQNGRR